MFLNSIGCRFLENKDDIGKLRKCFAGLWSLDDSNIIKEAIERPEVFVMKPQREGGGIIIDKLIVVVVVSITVVVLLTMSNCPSPGNNIYGDDVRETLLRLQKEGTEEDAAYILMQRIFPNVSPTFLMREGICYKDHAISELGIYGAYLRYLLSYNKINERHNFLVCQSLILGIYTMLNGIHQTASLIPHVECT